MNILGNSIFMTFYFKEQKSMDLDVEKIQSLEIAMHSTAVIFRQIYMWQFFNFTITFICGNSLISLLTLTAGL